MDTVVLRMGADGGQELRNAIFADLMERPFCAQISVEAAGLWKRGEDVIVRFSDYHLAGVAKVMDFDEPDLSEVDVWFYPIRSPGRWSSTLGGPEVGYRLIRSRRRDKFRVSLPSELVEALRVGDELGFSVGSDEPPTRFEVLDLSKVAPIHGVDVVEVTLSAPDGRLLAEVCEIGSEGDAGLSKADLASPAPTTVEDAPTDPGRYISDKAVEEGAQALYDTWSWQTGWVPWVPSGNSLKQDEARRAARTVLVAAWRVGLQPEIDEAMVERDAKPTSPCPTCNGNRWLGAREILPGSTPENTISRDVGRACPDCSVSTGGADG